MTALGLGLSVLSACVLVALAGEPASAKGSPCSTAKMRAAGKSAHGRAQCWATALTRGPPVNTGCLAHATARFGDGFEKAEQKPLCITTGDATAISDKIDAFVADVCEAVNATALGPSTCDAKKLRAAGKKARIRS
jgi:hypothetical protein